MALYCAHNGDTMLAGVFGFGVFAPISLGGVFVAFLFDAGESPERRFFFEWLAKGC